MAKFKFNLEPVLYQRRVEEEKCQRDLAKALRQQMILRDQLQQMQQTITGSRQALADGLIGSVRLDQMMDFARYSGQVRQRAMAFVTKLAATEKLIEAARARLMQATRARKALDVLRDRRYQEWQKEIQRREANQLDELAVQQYARRLMIGDNP